MMMKTGLVHPSSIKNALVIFPLVLLTSSCGNVSAPAQLLNAIQIAPSSSSPPSSTNRPVTRTVSGTPIHSTRDQDSLRKLFAKGTVSGADLLTELSAVKKLTSGPARGAVKQLLGADSTEYSVAAADSDIKSKLASAALSSAMSSLDNATNGTVISATLESLQDHLHMLLDDPKVMLKETISMPSAERMNPQQMQRTVTMAAVVLATRATAKILAKAKEDFTSVESQYTDLISQREKAASLLYEILGKSASGELNQLYSKNDLAYLKSGISSMSIAQFSTDLGAQNLALKYIAKNDPKAFSTYTAKSSQVLRETRGIIRTVAGVAAYGALLSYVATEISGMAKREHIGDLVAMGGITLAFASESGPVMKYAAEAAYHGIEVNVLPSKRFRVITRGQSSAEEFNSASSVFDAVVKANDLPALQQSLFRTGAPGLLYRLYQCDPRETGRMLDAATSATERNKLASTLQLPDESGLLFAKAFADKKTAYQRMGEDLLQRDHRERTDLRSLPLASIQKSVAGTDEASSSPGFMNWGNEQLLRLIYINREGSIAHASLELGSTIIRPIPSMQSIYIYDSIIDSCRQLISSPDEPPKQPTGPRSRSKGQPAVS